MGKVRKRHTIVDSKRQKVAHDRTGWDRMDDGFNGMFGCVGKVKKGKRTENEVREEKEEKKKEGKDYQIIKLATRLTHKIALCFLHSLKLLKNDYKYRLLERVKRGD